MARDHTFLRAVIRIQPKEDNHLTREQLRAFIYSPDNRPQRQQLHLKNCSECRASLERSRARGRRR